MRSTLSMLIYAEEFFFIFCRDVFVLDVLFYFLSYFCYGHEALRECPQILFDVCFAVVKGAGFPSWLF